MIAKILVGLVVVVAVFFSYLAFQPTEMRVSREIVINASPEQIFPFINNGQKADSWMPWKETDPTVKITYSGPSEGVGSASGWASQGKMGIGQALVVESIENQLVKTKLTYVKPMSMTQFTQLSLQPTSNGTVVQWLVTGQNKFGGRLMHVFLDVDKLVGSQFEKGLTNLKTMVESESKSDSK